MKFNVEKLSDLNVVIAAIIPLLERHKILLLKGALGAGKTTFASALVKQLGAHEAPSSPTFSLVNEYTFNAKNGTLSTVYHIDLYRVNSLEEALNMGIEEYLYSGNICLIEWPEIITDIIPEDFTTLEIESTSPTNRKFRIFSS